MEKDQKEKIAFYTLLLTPLIVFYAFLLKYSTNMPFWDDYDSIYHFMEKFHESNMNGKLFYLFKQHNEHRIVFDRIVFLLDKYITGYVDIRFLQFFGFIGLFSIFLYTIVLSQNINIKSWKILPFSFLIFNLSQWSLIPFAMASIQQYWQLFFALVSIYIMADEKIKLFFPKLAIMTTLSCFTGAGGFILFPVGVIQFASRRQWKNLAYWTFLASTLVWIYFVFLTYVKTEKLSIIQAIMNYKLEMIIYFFAFIGTPGYFLNNVFLFILGVLTGIVMVFWAVKYFYPIMLHKTDPENRRPALIALFILGTAAAAALSRISFGVMQADAPRYDIYGLLMIAVLYMAAMIRSDDDLRKEKIFRFFARLSIALFLIKLTPSIVYLHHRYHWIEYTVAYPNKIKGANILEKAMAEGIFKPTAREKNMINTIIASDKNKK